jgi:hypothetical protein
VDTDTMVSDYWRGRGGSEKWKENKFSDMPKGEGYAFVHTDQHNLFQSTVIFSLHEVKPASWMNLLKTIYTVSLSMYL